MARRTRRGRSMPAWRRGMGKLKQLEEARAQSEERERIRRLGEMPAMLDQMGQHLERLADLDRAGLDLEPLRKDVDRLRTDLAATLQGVPMALAAKLEPVASQIQVLSTRLDALPDVLARTLAEPMETIRDLSRLRASLDEALSAQRRAIEEITTQSGQRLDQLLGQVEEKAKNAADQSSRVKLAATAMESSARQVERAADQVEGLARKTRSWRLHQVMISTLAALIAALTVAGAMKWLDGTNDSAELQRLAAENRQQKRDLETWSGWAKETMKTAPKPVREYLSKSLRLPEQ